MKRNIQIALVILATPLLTLPVTSQTCAEVTEYSGMCDASAAIAVGPEMFVYWITSHGTNREGKPRPSRHRLFATEVKVADDKVTLTPVSTPYKELVKDLTKTPGLKDYKLGEAAKKPPE